MITEKANSSLSRSTLPKCIYLYAWGTQNCCDREPKFHVERGCSCLMKTLCIGACLGVTGTHFGNVFKNEIWKMSDLKK